MCGDKFLCQWPCHSLAKLCTKKLWKSVNICKRYSKKTSGTFFSWTRCIISPWKQPLTDTRHQHAETNDTTSTPHRSVAVINIINSLTRSTAAFHRKQDPVILFCNHHRCYCMSAIQLYNSLVNEARLSGNKTALAMSSLMYTACINHMASDH